MFSFSLFSSSEDNHDHMFVSSHHMQVHAHTTIGERVGPPDNKLFQFHPFVDHRNRNLSSVINLVH